MPDAKEIYVGFEWIDFQDADDSIFTFLRKGESGSTLLLAVNATAVPRNTYRVVSTIGSKDTIISDNRHESQSVRGAAAAIVSVRDC
jgi:1,4-alpha-glucan branching enzyme